MLHRLWLPVLLVSTVIAAQAAGPEPKYKAPRTETGQPDLRGTWNFSSDVPLERSASVGDRKFYTREEIAAQRARRTNALNTITKLAPVEAVSLSWLDYDAQIENLRTALIVYPEDGHLPKLVDGVRRQPSIDDVLTALSDPMPRIPPELIAAFMGGKRDGYEDLGQGDRCLGAAAPPFIPGFAENYVQIVQARDYVALLTEPFHHARIVPLDQRPHIGDTLREWSGDSRGHWEGDTLVVETRNFNTRTRSLAGAGTARDKVVTERFTRASAGALDYEATIVDPKTFQDKVVIAYPMAKVESRIFEVACHEGNYSISNILSGARKEEQEAAGAKP